MTSFTNTSFVSIPDTPQGGPESHGVYTPVTVSGYVAGQITVSVTVAGLSHTFPSDLDFLLLAPEPPSLEFWSDAGGGTDLVNATITVADGGSVMPATGSPGFLSGTTYAPADYTDGTGLETGASFGVPYAVAHAPPGGTDTFASVFGNFNPNGEWRLYVRDDAYGDVGSFHSWTLDVSATISGDSGSNTLVGGALSEHLIAGDGNDQLTGGGGADTLDGGYGFDFARYDTSTSGLTVHLDATPNTGDAFGDQLFSIEGIVGSNFDDQLFGDGADNSLYGIGGNDNLYGGAGHDLLDGGDGFDFARYDNATAGVTARLDGGVGSGDAAGDTFVNIEGLVGSAFDDTLVGDDGPNTIYALDGNDVVYGGGGNDALFGGEGGDVLNGGTGADMLDGGTGFDYAAYTYAASGVTARLDGGAGAGEAAGDSYVAIEGLYGSNFNDVLVGNNAVNVILAGSGNDDVYGLGGNDTIDGGAGDDVLTGGRGSDLLNGGAGSDQFRFPLSDLAPGDHDVIADFGEAAGNLDSIGLPSGVSITSGDTPKGVLITFHLAGGDADVLIQNFTAAQLADQYFFV